MSHPTALPEAGKLSNPELLRETRRLVLRERALQAELLAYIREVDSRRLYRELGYPSLFEFMTKELKYSEGVAQRRIDAARLSNAVPEVEAGIREGHLTLMALAQTQSVIRAEERRTGQRLSANMKKYLVKRVTRKSRDEANRALFDALPEASQQVEKKRQESIRVVNAEEMNLTLVVNKRLQEKLKRVREVAARRFQGAPSWSELFEFLADEYLERNDPVVKAKRCLEKNRKPAREPARTTAIVAVATIETASATVPTTAPHTRSQSKRRPLPASTLHTVWRRDEGRCQFTNSHSGIKCGSRRYLKIDHVIAVAHGGTNDIHNLRLLCRSHNQLSAEQTFEYARKFRAKPNACQHTPRFPC